MRKLLRKRSGGFTLIELMIVVAIIGILAAIAIPNFLRFQLRAKSSEGKTNLAAIRTAQEGYFAEFGTYVQTTATPATGIPGSSKAKWPASAGGFDTLGWSPEGDVYFQYEVSGNTVGSGAGLNEFMAAAVANIDGNAVNQEWGYVKPVPGSSQYQGSAPGNSSTCQTTGVYDPVNPSVGLLETVGPCDNKSGQSEF